MNDHSRSADSIRAHEESTRRALDTAAQNCMDQLALVIERWADWREAVMDVRELELGAAGMDMEALLADPVVTRVRELSPVESFDAARATCRNLPEALRAFSPDNAEEEK